MSQEHKKPIRVTKEQTLRAAKKLGVNLAAVSIETLQQGINVELEHGSRFGKTNVTHDSILTSLRIACAHLMEFPDYYAAHEKMEERLKKKWYGKRKPSMFD